MNISRSERFWKKVSIKELDGCWIWKAGISREYGSFRWDSTTTIPAPRAAYQLVYGPIKDNMDVLHKCDNKLCVNPLHLYLGDQVDNARDLLATGRTECGGCPALKLGEIWLVIKLHFSRKLYDKQIAKMFKVSGATISNIIRKHLSENNLQRLSPDKSSLRKCLK